MNIDEFFTKQMESQKNYVTNKAKTSATAGRFYEDMVELMDMNTYLLAIPISIYIETLILNGDLDADDRDKIQQIADGFLDASAKELSKLVYGSIKGVVGEFEKKSHSEGPESPYLH